MSFLRYLEPNPGRAKLVESTERGTWSSARAHLAGVDADGLLCFKQLVRLAGDWREFLKAPLKANGRRLNRYRRGRGRRGTGRGGLLHFRRRGAGPGLILGRDAEGVAGWIWLRRARVAVSGQLAVSL